MKLIADLQIHSRFSRATSKNLNLDTIEKYAKLKGINLIGTGDLSHPEWIQECKKNLTEDGSGILTSKSGFKFVLQGEISNIYTQDGKGRRIHTLLMAPNFDVVDQIQEALLKKGRIDYDGRPIFGFSCIELVEMMKSISEDIEIIPAHAWTPYFGIFGSKTGFNSVKECFKDQTKHIYAIETGLSSDPSDNWRLSFLDKYTLISSSDAHSYWPHRIGRECNIFSINPTYKDLIKAIRTKNGLEETIEYNVFQGKYHYTGHRKCNVCLSPKESLKVNNICPVCKKELTIGVAQRVEELADRPVGFKPEGAIPYKNLIPLTELIAGILKCPVLSNKVWTEYFKLIEAFGNELNLLINVKLQDLNKITSTIISENIIKNRNQQIKFKPGHDNQYGEPIFDNEETKSIESENSKQEVEQTGLSDFSN